MEIWNLRKKKKEKKKALPAYIGRVLKKKKVVECDLCFLPSSRPLFSFSFLLFPPFPGLWAENRSVPLQQVLGPANWERMVSGAAVPAHAPDGAVPLTPANPGEELLQPSCWEGWANGRQHFPNSANISSEREDLHAASPPSSSGGLSPERGSAVLHQLWVEGSVSLCGGEGMLGQLVSSFVADGLDMWWPLGSA